MLEQLTIWVSDTLVDVAGSNPIISELSLKNWKMNEDGFRKLRQNLNWERICTFANNDFKIRCKIQLVTQNITPTSEFCLHFAATADIACWPAERGKIQNFQIFLGLQWTIGKLWIRQLEGHFPRLWVSLKTRNAFLKEFWSELSLIKLLK